MKSAYNFTPGNVKKYTVDSKKKICHLHIYHAIYLFFFLIAFLVTFITFRLCILSTDTLSETIALGSIFATFGSSIVAIFSLVLTNQYDRFKANLSIFYTDLFPDNNDHWHRWPFIKRESHHTLYNKELTYQILTNATITFNVGSHCITLPFPTIKEDFYDLPNWQSLFRALTNSKHFESYVLNNIDPPATPLMIWDCMLDNLKCIAKYKIAKLFVAFGTALIFSSIILSFIYLNIPF